MEQWLPGARGEEEMVCCLVGIKFQFCKMKKFWKLVVQWFGYAPFYCMLKKIKCTVKMIKIRFTHLNDLDG
jgi:hypothetical protein